MAGNSYDVTIQAFDKKGAEIKGPVRRQRAARTRFEPEALWSLESEAERGYNMHVIKYRSSEDSTPQRRGS